MEKVKEPRKLPIKEMEKYVSEWFNRCKSDASALIDTPDEVIYRITDLSSNKVVYFHQFKAGEYSDDAVISTDGIINEELRGLVEQCIDLDRQLEESIAASIKQKGE